MKKGTLLFVHGTGVRLANYNKLLETAMQQAMAAGILWEFVPCAWGDPLGVEFEGKCLPDISAADSGEQEFDFARWQCLFDDPMFELDKLTIRDMSVKPPILPPGQPADWEILWTKINSYQPSLELHLLLERCGLLALWDVAWSTVIQTSPITKLAFQRSWHELPEASSALARSLIAQLHVLALNRGLAGPSRSSRSKLVERLLCDWRQQAYARSNFFEKMLKRAATQSIARHRARFTKSAALPIGDILLYQTKGEAIRSYIRAKIEIASPPVTIIAHSLGGVAAFDLCALPNPPTVCNLITIGSQAPFFYEIGASSSINSPDPLPESFPRWLNIYDENDFLSYVAANLFPSAADLSVESGQPFPDSHSAYFSNYDMWNTIRIFIS